MDGSFDGRRGFCLVAFIVGYVASIVLCICRISRTPAGRVGYLTMVQPFSAVLRALRWKQLAAFTGMALVFVCIAVFLRQLRNLDLYLSFLGVWLGLVALSAGLYFIQMHGFGYHQLFLISVVVISSGLILAWLIDQVTGSLLRQVSWLRFSFVSVGLAAVCLGYSWYVARKSTFAPPVMTRDAAMDPFTASCGSSTQYVLMLLTNIVPISPLRARTFAGPAIQYAGHQAIYSNEIRRRQRRERCIPW